MSSESLMQEQDLSVSIFTVLLHAIWMTALFIVVPLIPFALLWQDSSLWLVFINRDIILPVLVLIVLHELIHAFGWMYAGRLSYRDFKFGLMWRTLSPYCHATKPMSIRAYRFGAVLPMLILGIFPIIIATFIGDAFVAMLGAILTAGSVGDVYVLWTLRDVETDAYVIDHPTRVGCIVLRDG